MCHNPEDHNKATRGLRRNIPKCLKQRSFKQYAEIEIESHISEASYLQNRSLISFYFEFPSKNRIVHEEILILDEVGLLGSLGGSLGLFMGFSLYGYISTILETLFNQLAPAAVF